MCVCIGVCRSHCLPLPVCVCMCDSTLQTCANYSFADASLSPSLVLSIVARAASAALSLAAPLSLSLSSSRPPWFHFRRCKSTLHCARALSRYFYSPCLVSLAALHLTLAFDTHTHAHSHTVLSRVLSHSLSLSLIKSTVCQLAENGSVNKRRREREGQATPLDICEIIIYLNSCHMCHAPRPAYPY